ncbi:MAG: hypothetical protein FMNOHCHN_03763 [Ignavibacteriaceae bacterium]|nr:hypothetical protein [Ignavibacteriaceae bacterium]
MFAIIKIAEGKAYIYKRGFKNIEDARAYLTFYDNSYKIVAESMLDCVEYMV